MKPSTVAVVAGSGVAGGVVAVTASQVGEWLTLAERITESPAGLLMFCMLVLVLLAWLLIRQWQGGQECEARIDKLLDAMRTLHTMLSMDERFADQMPTWDEFIDSKLDVRALNRKPKA